MTRTVHDPTVLRAIAHPVRNRILGELTAGGSMRAADVARELEIPANQASFHLRQLAKYGLVEEDPGAARDKRDRVWRAAEVSIDVDVNLLESVPGGRAATSVYLRHAASWGHLVVDAAYDLDDGRTDVHRSIVEEAVRLTNDEARAMRGELEALVQSWKQRTQRDPGHDDGRTTFLLHSMLLPYPEIPDATAREDA